MADNKTLMDDLLALSGNVLGNLLGARHEMKSQAKQRMDSLARHLDLVSRKEFDAAFAMLAKARAIQEEFAERLDALENQQKSKGKSVIKSRAERRLPSFKKSNRAHRRSNRG